MNWTQVDIYTATPAIDLLSVRLQDPGHPWLQGTGR